MRPTHLRLGAELAVFALVATGLSLAPRSARGELAELDLTTLEYATELGKARGLELKSRVTTERVPMAAIRAEKGVKGGPLDPRRAIEADTTLYRRLGLVEWDGEPSALEWPWLPGVYASEDERVLVAREARGPHEKAAHIIAVQLGLLDQWTGLGPLTLGDNSDHALAREAFLLGDAVVSWLSKLSPPDAADLDGRLRWAREQVLGLVPEKHRESDALADRLVRARLQAGVEGLLRLRDKVPWSAVNRFYTKGAPASTAQLLHTDKLLGEEAPRAVQGGGVEALAGLGEPTTGVVGELRLRLWLETWLQADVAARTTEGWTGDRYVIYPPTFAAQPWTATLLLMTTWDLAGETQNEEAIDFEGALQAMLRARSKEAPTPVEGAPEGTTALLDEHQLASFVERRDEKVLFLDGCPPEHLARIREQAWTSFEIGTPASGITGPLAPPPPVAEEIPIPPWYRRTPGLVALGLWLLVVLPLLGYVGTRLGGLNPVRIYVFGFIGTLAFILIGWVLGL